MGEETEELLSSQPSPPLPISTEPGHAEGKEVSGGSPPPPAEEKGPAEKTIEETSKPAEGQEEKPPEGDENADEKTVVENRALTPEEESGATPFVEESYYVKDLKDSEKKALQDFKAKIADAINSNTFLAPSAGAAAAGASRAVNIDKAGDEEKKDGGTAEAEETSAAEDSKAANLQDEENQRDISVSEGATPIAEEQPKEVGMNLEEIGGKEEKPDDKYDQSTIETSSSTAHATATDAAANDAGVETATIPTVPEVAPAAEEEKVMIAEEPPPSHDRDVNIEAEDEESPNLENLALWGVPLLHSKGDERTDVVLLKFLRARDFKVNDAMSMLEDTMLWRKEFNADDLLGEEEITTEFDSVAYMFGVDREGHPVCYNHFGVFQDKELYQKTFGDEAQFKKFLRWRIQVLEKGMQGLDFKPSGVHSMVQVTDLNQSPGFVKRRNITKKALTVLQDNYPELVAKQIFVNVPWYFGALYALHGRLITARSKSKVVMVRPEKVTETLFKYISVENIPVRYGGFGRVDDHDFEGVEAPVQEVVIKPGEKQTIELPELQVGSTVVWDVVVVGWDVVYGEEFVPSGEGKYTVIIQKPKKVTAAEEPLRNSFKATVDAGKVVLTIENSSRKKKLVEYRYTIKQQDMAEMAESSNPPP